MKRNTLSIIILIVLGIVLALFWVPTHRTPLATDKEEVRAAIDIGSGATNLKVATVDPKTSKIITQLYDQSIPVPYQKHLEQSTDETFDAPVMDQGIQAIKALKATAETYHVKKVVAVATAAFRKAHNAEQFAKEIEKQTGVQVRIINQDEEGILAFRGALGVTSVQPEQAITWDIGGGSMQLTTLTKEGAYIVEKGKTASIPFKNDVIEKIEHKDFKSVQSPNPMTLEEMQASINYAATIAGETHPFIKEKILEPQTKILAVGSLFNYGIRPMIKQDQEETKGIVENKDIVKQSALEKVVMQWAGKTDTELPGGSLAEVAVTNPLLVLGYMQGLHIDQVEVVSVNNADGVLTYPPYWE